MQGGRGADRAMGVYINTLPFRMDLATGSPQRTNQLDAANA